MSDSAVIPPAQPMPPASFRRRLPIGAELAGSGTAHVRVWAPHAARVDVVSRGGEHAALTRDDGGYFSGTIAASAGYRYQFTLDEDEKLYPDPASRFQPDGPHGLSEIVDPAAFRWTDQDWKGVSRDGQVAYELHVGTFTRAGTWAAAVNELPELARLGISLIELMPVAEFEGRFGWGYDDVDLFAPSHLYGAPDDFRRFVDGAHAVGIGVILDVVYNHLGPSGNYLRATAVAGWTGRGFGWVMIGAGVLTLIGFDLRVVADPTSGAWLVLLGFFLENSARQGLTQSRLVGVLGKYSAKDLMNADPPVVDGAISVASLARGVLEINPRVCYFVEEDGRLAGILSAYQMRAVPEPLWDRTTAAEAMAPRARLHSTPPEKLASELLLEMETDDLTHMPVVQDGRVVGVVGRDRILGVLRQAGLLRGI